MNIITHSRAYSLYPRETFVERRGLICKTNGAEQEIGRQKYRDRGWTLIDTLHPFKYSKEVSSRRSAFRPGQRWIGDRLTWTIDLGHLPTVAPSTAIPKDMAAHSWNLVYDAEDYEAKMRYYVLMNGDLLKFNYVTANLMVAQAVLALIEEKPFKEGTKM